MRRAKATCSGIVCGYGLSRKIKHMVSVEAEGLPFGGWSFECANEHSARLAVDAINYAAGSDDIGYSRKAFSEEGR